MGNTDSARKIENDGQIDACSAAPRPFFRSFRSKAVPNL